MEEALRITCRKEENETGLARVCQSPRGFVISVDGKKVARVGSYRGLGAKPDGWHWYGGDDSLGIPRRNSSAEGLTYETKEACRDACIAYLKTSIDAAKKGAKT